MDPTLVPLAHDSVLERIRPEIYSRGNVYAATDQRKTFLILSQKLINTQYAIASLAVEECSIASLYEAADPVHRTAKCGSFRINKLSLGEAPAWVSRHRRVYSKVYIAASNPRFWSIRHPDQEDYRKGSTENLLIQNI